MNLTPLVCYYRLADFSLFFSQFSPLFSPNLSPFSPHFQPFLVFLSPNFSAIQSLFIHFLAIYSLFGDLVTFLKNQSLLYQFSNFQPIFCINSHSHEIFPLCQGMFTIQLPVCVCVYRTLFSSCKIPIFSLKMVISPIFGDQGPFCPFQAVLGSILAYFLA